MAFTKKTFSIPYIESPDLSSQHSKLLSNAVIIRIEDICINILPTTKWSKPTTLYSQTNFINQAITEWGTMSECITVSPLKTSKREISSRNAEYILKIGIFASCKKSEKNSQAAFC